MREYGFSLTRILTYFMQWNFEKVTNKGATKTSHESTTGRSQCNIRPTGLQSRMAGIGYLGQDRGGGGAVKLNSGREFDTWLCVSFDHKSLLFMVCQSAF